MKSHYLVLVFGWQPLARLRLHSMADRELVPLHKTLKPSSTCFEVRKSNVHVPSERECFHADQFCRHHKAVAPGSANARNEGLLKFLELALFPTESLAGSGDLGEGLHLHTPAANTLFVTSNLRPATCFSCSSAYFATLSLKPAVLDHLCRTAIACFFTFKSTQPATRR